VAYPYRTQGANERRRWPHTHIERETRTRGGRGGGTSSSDAKREREVGGGTPSSDAKCEREVGEVAAHPSPYRTLCEREENAALMADRHRTRYANERGYGWHDLIERDMRMRRDTAGTTSSNAICERELVDGGDAHRARETRRWRKSLHAPSNAGAEEAPSMPSLVATRLCHLGPVASCSPSPQHLSYEHSGPSHQHASAYSGSQSSVWRDVAHRPCCWGFGGGPGWS